MARSCRVIIVVSALVFVWPNSALSLSQTGDCPPGTIHTVAGGGVGDGGMATEAWLNGASGLAFGPDGSLYIADSGHNRVRKVGPDGIITTVAGDGSMDEDFRGPFAGDGGPAIQASLWFPCDVAIGPDGSLYIAEWANQRVRKVDPAGVITTVAGDGWTDEKGHGRFAGDGGPATEASLYDPLGVAVGRDGSLYIADAGNRRIRKVGPDGVIATVAGNGGDTYTGDEGDGGPATDASLGEPWG